MTSIAKKYDVVVVGAGPSGLSTAIKLKQLSKKANSELSVCVIEKGSDVGSHILSGAVVDPITLNELIDNNILEHEPGIGLSHYSTINIITSFVPYALGQINAYWIGPAAGLIGFWGYVGIFALFFSNKVFPIKIPNPRPVLFAL